MRKPFASLIVATFAVFLSLADAQTPAPSIDKAAKQDMVAKIGALLSDRYIFPDRAAQAKAKIDGALQAGEYDSVEDPNDFARRLTADLRLVTHDKHVSVFYTGGPPPIGAQQSPPPTRPPNNADFARVDRLKGNIGYIRLLGFPPPSLFNPVANDAMHDLSGTDALIIDMRDNGGGSAEADSYFGSFFFDPAKPVQLNSIVNRTPSTNEFITTEFWAKPVATPYLNKPVYILTSMRTFSAGEAFIYDLQAQRRVSIYGETTGGGANPGGVIPVGPRYSIFVPSGRALNPVTKTNWEGVGVVPDHLMDKSLAFRAAMSDAVTQLLKKKNNDRTLIAVKAALVQETEPGPGPFVEAALLKLRTTASPGVEAALRSLIGEMQADQPLNILSAEMAGAVQAEPWHIHDWGALKSIVFTGFGPAGADIYIAQFEKAKIELRIFPLLAGKINYMSPPRELP